MGIGPNPTSMCITFSVVFSNVCSSTRFELVLGFTLQPTSPLSSNDGLASNSHLSCLGIRPLELLLPGPRLSKATEATLARYCDSAVDSRGDKRVVRTERLPPEDFCFDAAQVNTIFHGVGSLQNAQVFILSRAKCVVCAKKTGTTSERCRVANTAACAKG